MCRSTAGRPTACSTPRSAISPAHSQWQFVLWGKNLGDKVVPSGFNAGSPPDEFYVSDPRTFGVRINYKY